MNIPKIIFNFTLACALVVVPSLMLSTQPVKAARRYQYTYTPQNQVSDPNYSAGSAASFNWAGYVAMHGTFSSVTGSWIVPTVTNKTSGTMTADAAWVGIGGITSNDLIQAGTQTVIDDTGQTEYIAWIETLPDASESIPLTIHPGDTISVAISETAPQSNVWMVSFRNMTTGKNYSTTVKYASSHSSAEWIEEMPLSLHSGFIPLDNFGTIQFLNGTTIKDGQAVTIADAGAQPMTMVNSDHTAIASTSGLTNNGSSFSVTRTSTPITGTPQDSSSGIQVERHRGHGVWRVTITTSPGTNVQVLNQIPPEIQQLLEQINEWQAYASQQMMLTQQQVIRFVQVQLSNY